MKCGFVCLPISVTIYRRCVLLSQLVMSAVSIRNLGVLYNALIKCFESLRHYSNFYLRRIRRYLPLSVPRTVATALYTSKLNYCNSFSSSNIAFKDITKLQC